MGMEQPPPQGFPEGYDPKVEVEEILSEDHSQDKGKAASESFDRYNKAGDVLSKSRTQLMQSMGLMAVGGAMAPTAMYMGANFQELVATSPLSTMPAEALLGAMLAIGVGSTLGGIGGGIAQLVNGIKGMRQGMRDKQQAKQDVRTYTGNAEALR